MNEFMNGLNNLVNALNTPVWNLLIFLLLGTGLFFSFSLRFVQFRLFNQSVKEMWKGKRRGEIGSSGITPFQAFVTGVASRVGVGNIAGVALAITVGGPGAVFWMWIVALVGMASAVAESSLAQLYKVRDPVTGHFRGGPAYYISQGFPNKTLGKVWATLFALLLISTYGFVFNAVQANTLVQANAKVMDLSAVDSFIAPLGFNVIPVSIQGIVLVVITGFFVFGGLRSVASFCEKLVPLMAILYIIMALVIIAINISHVPGMIGLIFKDAFTIRAGAGGVLGGLVSQGMLYGIKRGLFSNEAGMGSAPNAAAASDVDHPVNQGLIQMFGVFIDTIVICSATAFIVLLSGNYENIANPNGVQLTQEAITNQVGAWGQYFVAIVVFLFAWSSILGNYSYSESNVQYLTNSKTNMNIYRCLVLAMVYFGSVAEVPVVWNMADLFMGLMAIINLTAIIYLAPQVKIVVEDFWKQLKRGDKNPHFNIDQYPKLRSVQSKIWSDLADAEAAAKNKKK